MDETIRMVVTVKAYPVLSTKYHEAVCIAGVRTDSLFQAQRVRLFPVQFRGLPRDQQFDKWDEIEVRANKHNGDRQGARPSRNRPGRSPPLGCRVVEIIGAKPRPRVLIYGLEDRVDQRDALLQFLPTALVIESPSTVRQAEWDLVISDRSLEPFEDTLYGIGVGCDQYGGTLLEDGEWAANTLIVAEEESIATEFLVPAALDSRVEQLVRRQLVPLAQSRPSNPMIRPRTIGQYPRKGRGVGAFQPFLTTTEPEPLAAGYSRPTGEYVWCLPTGVPDVVPWVRAALSVWHAIDPARFPFDPSWREEPRWLTQEELTVRESLERLNLERTKFLADADARERKLQEGLNEARNRAAATEGRLLAASGEPLVLAVKAALEAFGFSVSNRDEVNPPNDRLEDLWVTSPIDDPEWIAIVEVRGYKAGAAQGDLLRLSGRFAKRYLQATGREPTRLWYVVNHFVEADPASRPSVLATNPGEVKAFEDEGGLVMSTTALFEAMKGLRKGEIDTDSWRLELMQAVGRWPPPS